MNSTLGSSAAEALTASPVPEPPRYKFRDTQARQARRAPAQQVHPTPPASRPSASRSKRKRNHNQDDDRGNAVAQPGAASRASKKPRLAITQTKGRPANSKGATTKKTETPLKKADQAHKKAREEKEKTLQRERAREERKQRYERRRASAEERQRA